MTPKLRTISRTIFMQNKPKLLNTKINVTSVLGKYYKNKCLYRYGKNKPNQTQFPGNYQANQTERSGRSNLDYSVLSSQCFNAA